MTASRRRSARTFHASPGSISSGSFGGDSHRSALVDLGLALAVLAGDLGHLVRESGLVVADGQAEDLQCWPFALGRGEGFRFGHAGQSDAAVQALLDPDLSRSGVLKPSGSVDMSTSSAVGEAL